MGLWEEAARDYQAAADMFLENRERQLAKIARGQYAFSLFEAGQVGPVQLAALG